MNKPKRNKLQSNIAFAKAKERVSDSNSELVKFSFKYFVDNHPKFIISRHDTEYFVKLIERLKNVSSMTINEFRRNGNKTLRAHEIDWNKTTESGFGIPGEDQLADEPYQFALSANEYGRIHGFLIHNRFYIVWFDKDHKLFA